MIESETRFYMSSEGQRSRRHLDKKFWSKKLNYNTICPYGSICTELQIPVLNLQPSNHKSTDLPNGTVNRFEIGSLHLKGMNGVWICYDRKLPEVDVISHNLIYL